MPSEIRQRCQKRARHRRSNETQIILHEELCVRVCARQRRDDCLLYVPTAYAILPMCASIL